MKKEQGLSIYLLGSLTAQEDNQPIKLSLRRKSRALFAYLLISHRPFSRQALSDLFCQETKDPAAALRILLSRIRRQFGSHILLTNNDLVTINTETIWVDANHFATLLTSSSETGSTAALTETLALYRGDFLSGLALPNAPEFELWLLAERTRLRQLFEQGLTQLIRQLITAEQYTDALTQAQRLVKSNPLAEEGHARLIWLHARTGQLAAARQHYTHFRQLLHDELAVPPSAELQTLFSEIEAGEIRPTFTQPLTPPTTADTPPKSSETTVFVNRESELQQLQQAWQQATKKTGQVLIIGAEAGVGKTSLIQTFTTRLAADAYFAGTCYESTQALPYHPWINLLEAFLPAADLPPYPQWPPLWRDYLTRLLPSLTKQRRQLPPPAPTTGGETEQLFTAVTDLLCQATDRPLLIFLDNLQWADEATMQLFRFMAQRIPQEKVLLVGSYRLEELADTPSLQTLLGDLNHMGAIRLQLSPLDLEAITQLAAHAHPQLQPPQQNQLAQMLTTATVGNPLFITELLREMGKSQSLPERFPVPQSLRELIQRRLRQLPNPTRQVIEAIAVLETPTSPLQIQEVSGRSQTETFLAIDQGLNRGLLQPAADGRNHYTFSHDLLRETVTTELSHIRRSLLHQRAAVTLEQGGAPAAALTYHWQMAGDSTKEGHFAAQAGTEAKAVYAHEDAIKYWWRASKLLTTVEAQLNILLDLADLLIEIGKWQDADEVYNEVLARTAAADDQARPRARAAAGLAWLKIYQAAYSDALPWLHEARQKYEHLKDTAGLGDVFGGFGHVYTRQGHYQQALTYFQRRLHLADAFDSALDAVKALSGIGLVYGQMEEYDRALEFFEQELKIAAELGDKRQLSVSFGNAASMHQKLFNVQEAVTYRIKELELSLEIDDVSGVAFAVGNLGSLYLGFGEMENAQRCFAHQLKICLQLDDRWSASVAMERIARTYAQLGQLESAEHTFRQAIALARSLDLTYSLAGFLAHLAEFYLAQNRFDLGRAANDEALLLAHETNQRETILQIQLTDHHLRVRQHESTPQEGISSLEMLLNDQTELTDQAAILYLMWQLDPTDTALQKRTAALYHQLYTAAPMAKRRRRYHTLTGTRLPKPPPLLPLPAAIATQSAELQSLLTQANHLISEIH